MRKATVALMVGALVAGLLAVGCGGDDDSGGTPSAAGADAGSTNSDGSSAAAEAGESTSESATLSKADFIKQANAICAATVRKITAEASAGIRENENAPGYNQEAMEIDLTATVLAPSLRDELDELNALGVPSGEEEQVNAVLGSIEKVIDEVELDPQGTVNKNRPYATAEASADRYGLTNCPYG